MFPTRYLTYRLPPRTRSYGGIFRKHYPKIFGKVTLQVRRTPRRLTKRFKTNREARWKLNPAHPDYTEPEQIPLIEAKLLATLLEFGNPPSVPAEVAEAAGDKVQ